VIPLGSVLLVEDDADDVLLMRRAVKKAGLPDLLKVVDDGDEAVAYLSGDGDPAGAAPPSFVLLDLKIPKRSGFEVLAWIRSRPGLRRVPVIVLTSSNDKNDVDRAYELGANAYLIKPAAYNDLVELLKAVATFWILWNTFPSLHPGTNRPR